MELKDDSADTKKQVVATLVTQRWMEVSSCVMWYRTKYE